MPKFRLQNPLPIKDLLEMALQHPDSGFDPSIHRSREELVGIYLRKLVGNADKLNSYFSIEIGSA